MTEKQIKISNISILVLVVTVILACFYVGFDINKYFNKDNNIEINDVYTYHNINPFKNNIDTVKILDIKNDYIQYLILQNIIDSIIPDSVIRSEKIDNFKINKELKKLNNYEKF